MSIFEEYGAFKIQEKQMLQLNGFIHIIFFSFLDSNTCCGYSLEAPQMSIHNMLLSRNKITSNNFRLKKEPYLELSAGCSEACNCTGG